MTLLQLLAAPSWLTRTSPSLLPPVAMVAGALLAVWRPPASSLYSAILHFAASVIFPVAVEILSLIVHDHSSMVMALGFTLSVMLALRQLICYLKRWAHPRALTAPSKMAAEVTTTKGQLAQGLLIATGTDIFLTGLLLAIGFTSRAREGTLLVVLAFELLVLVLAHGRGVAVSSLSAGAYGGHRGSAGWFPICWGRAGPHPTQPRHG